MSKKRKPKKRHPKIQKAIADVDKLQKSHQQMSLNLKRVKAALAAIPYTAQIPYRS